MSQTDYGKPWPQILTPIRSLMNSAKEVLTLTNSSANGIVGSLADNVADVANTALSMASNTLNSSAGVIQDVSGSAVHAVNGPVVATLNDTLSQASNIFSFNGTINRKPKKTE